jgi:hypothetical protein
MRFNCQFTVRNLLPAFRSIITKQLVTKHGLTQEQTASKLGITQAAISNYLSSKRAAKCRELLGDDFLPVYSLACENAEKLANDKTNIDEVKKEFCKICTKLREKYIENYSI